MGRFERLDTGSIPVGGIMDELFEKLAEEYRYTMFKVRPDTWFDEGTYARPVTEFWECFKDRELTQPTMAAIFRGIKDGKPDEESCPIEEFDILETPF